jgi:hypothetical protein
MDITEALNWARSRLEVDSSATGLAITIATEDSTKPGTWALGVHLGGRRVALIWVNQDRDPNTVVVALADQVQQVVMAQLGRGWPECVEHGVPLWVIDANPAMWECDRGHVVGEIGGLLATEVAQAK